MFKGGDYQKLYYLGLAAVPPNNAIYHKTQRHLIAPIQTAPAPQISHQP